MDLATRTAPTVATAPSVPAAPAVAPVPPLVRRAAHVAALVALPASLWRIGLVLGFPLGYTVQGRDDLVGPGAAGATYMVLVSVLSEVAAFLTLGLVQRWGEVVPRWVPYAGGKDVPARPVVIAAWAGVGVLAALWTPFLFWWAMPHDDMTGAGHVVVGFIYLPLVAWAPLMAVATLSYQRRHRRR